MVRVVGRPSACMVVSWHDLSVIWFARKTAPFPCFYPLILPIDDVNIKLRTEDLDALQKPVKGKGPDTGPFKPEDQSSVGSEKKKDDNKRNGHDETKYSKDISPESLLVSVRNDFNSIQCCEDIDEGDGKKKYNCRKSMD